MLFGKIGNKKPVTITVYSQKVNEKSKSFTVHNKSISEVCAFLELSLAAWMVTGKVEMQVRE